MESKEIAEKVVGILKDKKAVDVELFHVEDKTILTDYYVVCSGTSSTHIKALADEVTDEMCKLEVCKDHVEGRNHSKWVLIDFSTVVVNILREEDREYYDLETLFRKGHEERI